MKVKDKIFQKIIIIMTIIWLLMFVFLPNLIIVVISFLSHNEIKMFDFIFTLNNYIRLFNDLYAKVMIHSLNIALITTIMTLIIGYIFSFILVQLSKKQQIILLFLMILPFWTNSLIRIYGLKDFLSLHGYLNKCLMWMHIIKNPIRILYTETAVILGLVYILFPFMVFPLYSSIKKLDKNCIEAARDLGANKLQIFAYVITPLTMPGIIAGCLLVLLPAMGLFYIADLMGGAKNLLIGNIIKTQFLNLRDWPFGSATSVILTFTMGLLLYIYYRTVVLLSRKMDMIK
uniref:Spermidine/putrescine ABC transporter permease PotB n=1 Tax=Candidatus Aschnera chinzeii TaxID=1485666 RepID=A0AAT9G3R1_9ENTR|nr:MAG: spermidine/putrescine ABC transporter permease PotB [Candidatus Aschnera chinzeii]